MNDIKTITLQIGNSDDKLTQSQWSRYVHDVKWTVKNHANEIHFFGGSANWEQWQNACWVFTTDVYELFLVNIKPVREMYKQESVAVTIGETKFI